MHRIVERGRGLWTRVYRLAITAALRRLSGLQIGDGVVFDGWPVVEISSGATVRIDNGCTINSANRGYHVSMFAPVKLFADCPGALITIGEQTRIHGSCLHAYSSISIGRRCLIAANCQIFDGSGHDASFDDVANRINTKGNSKPIVIEDDVWIGANSIVLPGVRIGRGSIIGAGSIVTKSIPSMVLAAGNPAKVVRDAGERSAN
jgi:acetyltransferase-like isoleucine patch superfamily enzyme